MTMSTTCDLPGAFPCAERERPSWVDITGSGGRWTVSGELDAYSAPVFVAAFTDRMDDDRTPEVRLDCSSLGFVDAGGLSALVLIARHVRAQGRRFHIALRGPSLDRLLRLCAIVDI